ncbi:dihydropteroate synthase [Natronobacterium gregoryi]|uniref:dihydropteroate synthase n=2 Tax=Natronobacterium gregoryi TaxID=44930 RepID=L0ABK3_NATGS|nr:dihydropteroate synthase [Natronobacterium gregoryi]AFZ71278.1 dihydropteroate synthase [Natronobacterium gregoryi SP2]ELY67367.1 dihydropteroate synthase [Natronobacterium gregoryi SP2]PLK19861.1 dihydropteroate synthase [Natronobacterium gregoryi SP2]SFJ39369.1 Dihydropteroate synthase [Natronobacterium gregoryi]
MNTVDAAGLDIGDGHPPRIMGVLNVSEESPYDPSVYDDPGEAAQYVDEQLIDQGADIVDIGLESANKRFEVLSAEAELERLHVALETIESVSGDAVFSIETRYASVADEAISKGFDVVNDICGFADPKMSTVCEEYDVAVAKMASPPDLQRPGAVEETDWERRKSPDWAAQADYVDQVYEALKQNGLTDKTIVDPAFGGWSEAQTVADDRETFRRLREFRALGQPILVSINRKNFLGDVADRDTADRLPVSLAATSMAVERGADVVRTHDVAETRDAALIGESFSERTSVTVDGVTISRLDVATTRELQRHLEERDIDPKSIDRWRSELLEIDGLPTDERQRLVAAAADAGASTHPTPSNGVLLAGTPATFSDLSSVLKVDIGGESSLDEEIENILQ